MNKEQKIKLFSNLATGAAIAGIFIATLLLFNYLQISRAGPLESSAMEALLDRLEEDPNDESLKTEIRNLDLLARKAFFNNQWQVNTGALLLLICTVIFGISLNMLNSLKSKIEVPEQGEPDVQLARKLSQRGIIATAAVLALLALGASYLTNGHLHRFTAVGEDARAVPLEEIEIIEAASAITGSQAGANEIPDRPVEPASNGESMDSAMVSSANQTGEEQMAITPVNYPSATSILQQHGAFRGPFGNGVSYHKNIPTEWNGAAGLHVLWKALLAGGGNNSPILWGDRLFLAATTRNSKIVYCYNRFSGALLWQKAIENVPGSPPAPPGSARPPPGAARRRASPGRGSRPLACPPVGWWDR